MTEAARWEGRREHLDYRADAVTFNGAVDAAGQPSPSGWRRVGTTAARGREAAGGLIAPSVRGLVEAMSGIEPGTRGAIATT